MTHRTAAIPVRLRRKRVHGIRYSADTGGNGIFQPNQYVERDIFHTFVENQLIMLKDVFKSILFFAAVITAACLYAGVDFDLWLCSMAALVIFYPIGYDWYR